MDLLLLCVVKWLHSFLCMTHSYFKWKRTTKQHLRGKGREKKKKQAPLKKELEEILIGNDTVIGIDSEIMTKGFVSQAHGKQL